jgi:hypothetical protein
MEQNAADQLLDELLASFEVLESQNTAILQFLKDKGIATEEQLAPYLEQAATASDIKWRAGRLRIKHLLSSLMKSFEEQSEKASAESKEVPADEKEEKASGEGEGKRPEAGSEKGVEPVAERSHEKVAKNASPSEKEAGSESLANAEQNDRSEQHATKDAA